MEKKSRHQLPTIKKKLDKFKPLVCWLKSTEGSTLHTSSFQPLSTPKTNTYVWERTQITGLEDLHGASVFVHVMKF